MSSFKDVNQEERTITYECETCSEKHGTKVICVYRVGQKGSYENVERFNRQHFYCSLDRNFQIEWIVLQLGRELDDKETTFAQSCMDEGMDRDEILEHIVKKRQKSYPVTY